MARRILSLLYFAAIFNGFGQEINAGINIGFIPNQNTFYPSCGLNLEFKPKNSIFSINTDPFILLNNKKLVFSEPVYFKFIFGNKLRICPSIGGFYRTNKSYGWLLGLNLEYVLKNSFILFSKNECYKDYRKDFWPDHFGGSAIYINQSYSLLFSLGLKLMIKN